jgi:copper transport protein
MAATPAGNPLPTPVLVGAGSPSTVDGGADGSTEVRAGVPPASSGEPESLRTIRRSVGAEVAIAAVVLVVTSLLVNAQPGRSALAQPFSTELDAKSVLIDVTVDPAKAGTTTMHVYTLSPEGAVKDVKELTADLELPEEGIGPITVPLRRAGPGHFSAYGFDLPIAGHWRLTVKALTSDVDEAQASTTFHVR